MKMAISNSQKAANRKWDGANKPRINYLKKRSAAKNFIKIADYSDIIQLKEWIQERDDKATENKYFDILEEHLNKLKTKIIKHSIRVANISMNIIEEIEDIYDVYIYEDEKELIYNAAILHDIAKFDNKKKHNKMVENVLSNYCEDEEDDDDFEDLCSIIKYHKGKKFKPDKDIAVMAAILRMADKIDKVAKNKDNAEEKYEKSLKKIKKYFKKYDKDFFDKFEYACEKVKKQHKN
nr:MAG TPA: Cyclic di-GMP phosphodiesterase [Caudoviricetes sp.]